ncbi:MAG: Crossover junction endodeoxyribonuclease RuvC [Candidatus Falkowbacteria bacterium GW2011_GWA2_39_24]|uniref:Crossover junction endodeoxyribonuclease RuvC n=1 Tax=Candidatus Falkowbacteria bacterium GW2011_GWA2_39_24 TaxID=1618634 RepID=A0A0G0QSG6_9BACT|nr:MAG: Crossover junction endodeoxyribonuclease RuvC [Candidatus Falkowbacteria bacterium GW2011_GWA2_39_24]
MIILGIDPGIADTGYGVIKQEGSNLTCLDYGSIQTSSKLVLAERLGILYQELAGIITKYQPERVAIEQLFFCKNVKTAMVVGQARGVVLLTCQQAQVPTVEFTPLQVKQAVAAYGGAGKMQVQKMVKILLHLNDIPRPDDAADALAIAICAANSTKIPV